MSHEYSCGLIVNYRNPVKGHVERCAESIIEQEYGNWRAYFCDDASDEPPYVPPDERIVTRRNGLRLAMVANSIYSVAQATEDIIVHVDGDDALYPLALNYIVEAHQRGADLTWGSAESSPFEGAKIKNYAQEYEGDLNRFSAPQPRSYRRSLFVEAWQRWGWSAFTRRNGKHWPVDGDIAVLYPLLRLARNPMPIHEILYYISRTGPSHDMHPPHSRAAIIAHVEALP